MVLLHNPKKCTFQMICYLVLGIIFKYSSSETPRYVFTVSETRIGFHTLWQNSKVKIFSKVFLLFVNLKNIASQEKIPFPRVFSKNRIFSSFPFVLQMNTTLRLCGQVTVRHIFLFGKETILTDKKKLFWHLKIHCP